MLPRIQTKLDRRFRLLGIVNDQELIRPVLIGKLHTIRAQCILHKKLCGIGMRCTLEDGHGTDLTGGAVLRDHECNVLIAVVNNLGNAIMQEANADHALARTNVLRRT